MHIPNLCHPLHWSSRPHLRGEAGPGDHWPIPRVSLLSVENFPTGNHIAENTVCGCNTRNSWLLQHDDIHSTFLAHKFVIINSQLCIQYSSQDVYKRGYVDVWSVCMQACKTIGGSGGKLLQEMLEALRLLLRPLWDRSSTYCILFGCPCIHLHAKPADFEFPQEKVLRLAEQQVGWYHYEDNWWTSSRAPEISIYLRVYLYRYMHIYAHVLRWSSVNKPA